MTTQNDRELRAEQERRERDAIDLAKRINRAVTYDDKDGTQVTAMPSGHVFYNALDWW